jgi:hypothetical protein
MPKKRVYLDPDELRRLYEEERIGIDAIAAKLHTSHGSVWRAMEAFCIPRRTLSEAITKHKRVDFSGDPAEQAYLIGFRSGDLWVRRVKPGPGSRTIMVSCHTTRSEQIALVQSLFSRYGHARITYDRSGSQQILCYLNESFGFLLAKQDRIASWILRKPALFLAFLAGYVDAEGSFCVDRHGHTQFQLKSYDLNILKQITSFLTRRLHVRCHPPRLAQARGSPTGKGYRLRQDAWMISIARKETLFAFCRLLEPHLRHAKRRNDLAKVLAELQAEPVL